MWQSDFKAQLVEALLAWLWRSWTSVGVSDHDRSARADRVIDPESLLLASTLWARYDARLFDEMLDWLVLSGSLINLQRLRNLHRSGLGDSAVLAAITAVLQEHSHQTKWKAPIGPRAQPTTHVPLFVRLDGRQSSRGKADPLFAAQGFHRGRLELRQLSHPPSPQAAPNFWLKLRSLFGTSTRAEIMLQLLTSEPATAGEIARRSGFTTRSVLVTLREMALSGHLYEPPRPSRVRARHGQAPATRTRGPSRAYALRTEDWRFLRTWTTPLGFPELKLPAPLLLLCQRLIQHLDLSKAGLSQRTAPIHLRNAVAESLEEIQLHGLSGEYGLPPNLAGDSLLPTLMERLPSAIANL